MTSNRLAGFLLTGAGMTITFGSGRTSSIKLDLLSAPRSEPPALSP
jgi:hypothetical protein